MKPKRRACFALAGLGPLVLLLVPRHEIPAPPLPHFSAVVLPPARPDTPFERSLRQAWTLRTHAILAENREREAMEEWDPIATAGRATETLRREDLAQDRSGDLRRARTAARQAVRLARTPMEAYRAAWLLGRIECNLGDHRAEWQAVRRLVALAPRNWRTREALRHAAVCAPGAITGRMERDSCRRGAPCRSLRHRAGGRDEATPPSLGRAARIDPGSGAIGMPASRHYSVIVGG